MTTLDLFPLSSYIEQCFDLFLHVMLLCGSICGQKSDINFAEKYIFTVKFSSKALFKFLNFVKIAILSDEISHGPYRIHVKKIHFKIYPGDKLQILFHQSYNETAFDLCV